MVVNIYAVPLICGFVASWIGAILIMYRGLNTGRYSDKIFAVLLISCSLLLLEYMFGYMGINILWQEMHYFPYDPVLALGPLFYFYFKAQINTDFRLKKKDFVHFLPIVLYSFYRLIIYMQGASFVHAHVERYGWIDEIVLFLSFASTVLYFIVTSRMYVRYKRWLKTEMPTNHNFSFAWFQIVLIAILLLLISMWTFTLINLLGYPLDYEHNVWQYIFLAMVLFLLAFEGYAQRQALFMQYEPIGMFENRDKSEPQKDQDDVKIAGIKSKIFSLMEHQKLYLNADITLTAFAREVGYSRSDVSMVINSEYHKNFSQFINQYRVATVCESLQKGEHKQYSLLGIAMNAGFNSKATFNRVFKEFTTMTPLQYAEKEHGEVHP